MVNTLALGGRVSVRFLYLSIEWNEVNLQNLTSDDETENGTLGEGVDHVGRTVLVVLVTPVHDHTTKGDRNLVLRVAELRDRNRCRNRHDRRSDQITRSRSHLDVDCEDGSGDGGKTRGHDQVDLRRGHDIDVGLDEARRLALADPGRAGGDDGLGTGDVHGLEEEPGKVLDDPLHDTHVVKHLHKGDEEHNSSELEIGQA
jgi:hypothetical protein